MPITQETLPERITTVAVACVAPPLSDETLNGYRSLICSHANVQQRDAMVGLLTCVQQWWELDESPGEDSVTKVRGKQLATRPLSDEIRVRLWDVIPYDEEFTLLSNGQGTGVLDSLTGPIRDAAFHLLWYVRELYNDREPVKVL